MTSSLNDKLIEIDSRSPEMIEIDDDDQELPIDQNCVDHLKDFENKLINQLDDDEVIVEKEINSNFSQNEILTTDHPSEVNSIDNSINYILPNDNEHSINQLDNESIENEQINLQTLDFQFINGDSKINKLPDGASDQKLDQELYKEPIQELNKQVELQLNEQSSSKSEEFNIIKIPYDQVGANSKTPKTVVLKLLPINGQKQSNNNLILKIRPESAPISKSGTTRPVIQTINPISLPTFNSIRTATAKPVIQTINPTSSTLTQKVPKLTIKPLKPPSLISNETNSTEFNQLNVLIDEKTNLSNSESNSQSNERLKVCIRENCNKSTVKSEEWDDEYCSVSCLVKHCKNAFEKWVNEMSKN